MLEELSELISVGAWEQALIRLGKKRRGNRKANAIDPLAVVEVAADIAGVDLAAYWDDLDPGPLLAEVLETHKVGAVGVDFPDSTHGDGLRIDIYRFPGAAAVGVKSSTLAQPEIVFVLPNATIDAVDSAAWVAIFDAQDGATWDLSNEGDDQAETDDAEGVRAVSFGFEALKEAWARWPQSEETKGA